MDPQESAFSTDASTTWQLSRRLFLGALALVHLTAFLSLRFQIDGLIGSHGILPADRFLDRVQELAGESPFWRLPTLAWWSSSDGMLHFLCTGGAVAALFALTGILAAPAFFLCWLFYLSLVNVGQEFLGFQWDMLLLEAGLLATFCAPWRLRWTLRRDPPAPRLVRWLLWWLLFRLMFCSGLVKLLSRDETWWHLDALRFHFETQPLPTWTAWYAHQLPDLVLKAMTGVMFAIELAVPLLIFMGRRGRLLAFVGLMLLQAGIMATGNYTFFNWLSMALCLPLLDDLSIRRMLPKGFLERVDPALTADPLPRLPQAVARVQRVGGAVFASMVLVITGVVTLNGLVGRFETPAPIGWLLRTVDPFNSFNRYGLFARMTIERPEIVIEGSNDGTTWKAYTFRWKPGDPARRPAFVQPHQPRLDWQMWFAALGTWRDNQWVLELMQRLLAGTPEVLDLIEPPPFDRPPRYLRAVVYDYRFTRRDRGDPPDRWWTRQFKGLYAPIVTLDDAGKLTAARLEPTAAQEAVPH